MTKMLRFNIIKLLALLLVIVGIDRGYAQQVRGDSLLVQITMTMNNDDEDGVQLRPNLHIDAYLTITVNNSDTLEFTTGVALPVREFYAKNIVASAIINGISTPLATNLIGSFPEQKIQIALMGYDNLQIALSYDIMGVSWLFLLSTPEELSYITTLAYHAMQENLYPEFGSGIEYQSIKVENNIDGYKLYPSHEAINNVVKSSDLNLTLVYSSKYKTRSFDYGFVNLNVLYVNSEIYDQHEAFSESFDNAINRLKPMFVSIEEPSIDIITAYWTNEKLKLSYGALFHNEYILCDIRFIQKHEEGLLHEILHILLPTNMEKGSPARYFLTESINEWLTGMLYSGQDSYKDFQLSEDQIETSLYDLEINNAFSLEYVYQYGPYLLQKFAEAEGYDKTFKAVVEFLISNKEKTISYVGFLSFLRDNGFSENSIERLDINLKRTLKK